MNVLLLHLDGKLPNVALMRVAAHHKALGDSVALRHAPTVAAVEPHLGDRFDKVYASTIFERTRPVAERVLRARPDALVGGMGWDIRRTLEDVGVTTKVQDYDVYPRFAPSIGLTQRGCRLKCAFCVVPRKEEQSVADIWRGENHPRHVLLLDNDFFGVPGWRDRIAELSERDARGKLIFRVCFSQGVNARMISEEAAMAIASVHYTDDSFKVRRVYTAWDSREDESTLFRGLDRLKAAGVKPDHVMVYMLIGYWPGETHAEREHRRQRLRAWGARPYPMPFQRTPALLGYARWVIGAYDKGIPWTDWARARMDPRGLGDRSGAQRHLPLFDAGEV